jgi:prevent-host-death family protein
MTADEARDNFAKLLEAVAQGNERVIVERKGKPVAVVMSPAQFERYEQQIDQRFREAIDELRRRNVDEDPDAVLHDVTETADEVRRERHEREQRAR